MSRAAFLAMETLWTLEWATHIPWQVSYSGNSLAYIESESERPVQVFCRVSPSGRPYVGIGKADEDSFQSLNGSSAGEVRKRLALEAWSRLLGQDFSLLPLEWILQGWLKRHYGKEAAGLAWVKGEGTSATLAKDLFVRPIWRGFPHKGYPEAVLTFTQESTLGNYMREVRLTAASCPYTEIMRAASFAVRSHAKGGFPPTL